MRLGPLVMWASIGVTVSMLAYLVTVHDNFRRQDRSIDYGEANVLRLGQAYIRNHDERRLRWEIWAEDAAFLEEKDETLLEVVRFRIYPEPADGGAPVIHGTARHGLLRRQAGIVILEDDVNVFEGDVTEFRGPKMVYRHKQQRLEAPAAVWVRHHGTIHQGHDLVYRIPEQQLTLQQPSIRR